MGKVRKVGKVTAIQEQHIKVKTVHKTIKTYSRKLTKIPEVLDVMDVCRICLQKIHFLDEESLISIYSKASHQEQDLAEMIQIISPVKIKLDEKLTDKICTSCNEKVTNSYNLRQQIIESDTALRKASARITIVPIDSLKNASIELVAKSSPPVALKKVKISPALAKAIQKARKQNKRVPPEKVIIPTVYQHLETSPLNIEHIKLEATSWIQPDHQPPPTDQDDDKNEIISKSDFNKHHLIKNTQDSATSSDDKSLAMSKLSNQVLFVELLKVKQSSSSKKIKETSLQQNKQTEIGQTVPKPTLTPSRNFLCSFCGQTFRYLCNLKRHLTEQHSQIRQRCNICSKEFRYLKSLLRHKKTAHENLKYVCDVCKVDYTTLYSLKVHILDLHLVIDEDLKVQCRVCDKKFNHAIVLTSHMKYGHAQKTNRKRRQPSDRNCLVCGQYFKSWHDFLKHKLSHMGNYKCMKENCGKLFPTYHKLYYHHHYLHINFACEICSYKTDSSRNMVRHKDMHAGIKRYGCDFCDKKFGQKVSALSHRNSHTGERPYKCKSCDNCYSDHGSLSKHKKKMHGFDDKRNIQNLQMF